jgi:hypothetical protein
MKFQMPYSGTRFDPKFCHVIKSRNELQINRIEYLKDKQRHRWVLLLESDLAFDQEVNVFIKEDTLIVEASRSVDYEKPFRSHLFDTDTLSEVEQGGVKIGFSELKLNHGNKYQLISSQVINPRLIKVILGLESKKEYN